MNKSVKRSNAQHMKLYRIALKKGNDRLSDYHLRVNNY